MPVFFFISGYLFFNKPLFNKEVYKNNIRKRIRSLLIPYILWTLIAFSVFAIFQILMPELQSGSHKPIKDWDFFEFIINCFWRYGEEGSPFVGQFWFLRDLMIICLISPILYFLIKKLSYYPVLCFGLLWLFEIERYFVPGTIGLFFFCWGAYYQIEEKDFLHFFDKIIKLSWFSIPLYIFDAASKTYCYNEFIHSLAILLGIPLVFTIGRYFVENKRITIPNILYESTFFIYAIHEPYYDQIKKIVFKNISISQNSLMANMELIILYLLMVVIYISILVGLFYILKRILPSFTKVLIGNR